MAAILALLASQGKDKWLEIFISESNSGFFSKPLLPFWGKGIFRITDSPWLINHSFSEHLCFASSLSVYACELGAGVLVFRYLDISSSCFGLTPCFSPCCFVNGSLFSPSRSSLSLLYLHLEFKMAFSVVGSSCFWAHLLCFHRFLRMDLSHLLQFPICSFSVVV